jgi:hypothetical protein
MKRRGMAEHRSGCYIAMHWKNAGLEFGWSKDEVRITISHNRTKEEIMQSIDRSFSEALQGAGNLPVKIVVEQKIGKGRLWAFP